LVVVVLLLENKNGADDEDAERDDAKLQEISGPSALKPFEPLAGTTKEEMAGSGAEDKAMDWFEDVEFEEEGVKRLPWCICMPSNPPIRSRNTNTLRRTSFVKGMYCRILVR
jgi:hypothetical protein